MLLGMLAFALVWLAELPFGLAGLWWERRHHISHVDYFSWIVDSWASLGGLFLFICLAIVIVMGLAGPLPRRWWLVGGPVFVGLALLFAFVQPWLTPGLHRLEDPVLVASAQKLERAEHVKGTPVDVEEVRSLTSAPNSEAAGFGPSRRVIVWDTLLDGRFSNREIRFVLAHEFGHLARRHIPKLIGWYALFALPGAFLIALSVRGRGGMRNPEAVPLALFVIVVLQLLAQPLQAAISRHVEAEADWMALRTTRDPNAGLALFRHLTTTTLSEPNPSTWDYLLLEDHPTPMQRIAMVKAWQERYATSVAQSP
jgi:STE24 endopeptidase